MRTLPRLPGEGKIKIQDVCGITQWTEKQSDRDITEDQEESP